MARIAVKICGLKDPENLQAALDGGAALVGFVFYPRSPRAVSPAEAAMLIHQVPSGIERVGLFVDPDDATLSQTLAIAPLSMVQLHGSETPERVAAVRALCQRPVMKAIALANTADLTRARLFEPVADRLLFDAPPPATTDALPGGNGDAFDWRLLAGQHWSRPWMLSGGLTADNVATAIRQTAAPAVDVSSGVEISRGQKDPALIRAFLIAAHMPVAQNI